MFDALPPELVLRIFALLDIQQLQACQLVSPSWNIFIKLNDSVLYRALAVQHNFISNVCTLDEAKTANPGPWMSSALNWKDFCQRFFMLDRNWHARGEPSRERLYKSSRGVHRFKLDEKHRLVIATFVKGGLKVFCMDTDELLFELPRTYVRKDAHCEYENGYLIFDRHDLMEVWKFGFAPAPVTGSPNSSPPDERQMQAYEEAVVLFPSATGHGILRPHALLSPPHSCRAYRFVYPTLLVGSFAGQRAFLYDIPTASLEESIPFPTLSPTGQGDNQDLEVLPIHYVELGPRHIFICSQDDIVILARDHENVARNRRILKFPSSERSNVYRLPSLARTRAYRIALHGCQSTSGIEERALSPPVQTSSTALVPFRDSSHNFCAVHVSRTGRSFAAITWTGMLFLVRDFERVLPSSEGSEPERCFSDEDVTLVIEMRSPLTNLSFGDDGQVVMHSFTAFHVVLWPESAPSAPRTYPSSLAASPHSTLPAAFSDVRLFNLPEFKQHNALPLISCLKVTRTGVWFDWSAKALFQRRVERRPAPPNRSYGHIASDLVSPHVTDDDSYLGPGERDEHIEDLMREDDDEPSDVDLDDPADDDDDLWNARRNPYSKRSLCRVDFSPRFTS